MLVAAAPFFVENSEVVGFTADFEALSAVGSAVAFEVPAETGFAARLAVDWQQDERPERLRSADPNTWSCCCGNPRWASAPSIWRSKRTPRNPEPGDGVNPPEYRSIRVDRRFRDRT